MSMRRLVGLLAGVALTTSCASSRELGARLFQVAAHLSPAPPRTALPGGIESVCSRGSLTWIVPVDDGGVVLIDTGFDDEARAIKAAVGARKIHAILLTHSHLDHAAGSASLDVPVYVGRDDAPALRGEHLFTALYPALGEAFGGIPVAKGPVHPVDDGSELVFGNRHFRVIGMPGHTHGSMGYLLDDVFFSGDAVLQPLGDELYPAGPGFTVDDVRAYDSIRNLRGLEINWLADAHIGVRTAPGAALRQAIERDHSDVRRQEFPLLRPVACGDDPLGL
jgi:glyoxylase-like metal-dependent hydrolase (beta-lactamase superfamily II)